MLNAAGGDAVEKLRREREFKGDAPYATKSASMRAAKEEVKIKAMMASAKPIGPYSQLPPEFGGLSCGA